MIRPRLSAVLAAALIVGCGLLPEPDVGIEIAELDATPRQIETGGPADAPEGPAVEIVRGRVDEILSVVVQRGAAGVCLAIYRGAHGSTSCGPIPGEDGVLEPFGMVSSSQEGDPVFEVAGIVAPTVASVVLELEDESRASALLVSLQPAEIDASAFFVYLSEGVPHSVVALGPDGEELARLFWAVPNQP